MAHCETETETETESIQGPGSTQQLLQDIGSEIHRILKGCKESRRSSSAAYKTENRESVTEEKDEESCSIPCDVEDSASILSYLEQSYDPLGSTRSDLPSPYEVWQRGQPKEVDSRVYHPVLSRQEIHDISNRLHCISTQQREKIEQKRVEQERRESASLSFAPTINSRSKRLMSNTTSTIQERAKRFIQEKEAKLQKERERLVEEEMREVRDKPEVLKSTRWQPRIARKYVKSVGFTGTETADDCHLTFSPAITQKSCQIVAKAEKEGRRQPVWEPCQPRASSMSAGSESSSMFIPRINTRSRSLSRPGKDVYNRLYSIRKQSVAPQDRKVKVKVKRQTVVYKPKYAFILEKLHALS